MFTSEEFCILTDPTYKILIPLYKGEFVLFLTFPQGKLVAPNIVTVFNAWKIRIIFLSIAILLLHKLTVKKNKCYNFVGSESFGGFAQMRSAVGEVARHFPTAIISGRCRDKVNFTTDFINQSRRQIKARCWWWWSYFSLLMFIYLFYQKKVIHLFICVSCRYTNLYS